MTRGKDIGCTVTDGVYGCCLLCLAPFREGHPAGLVSPSLYRPPLLTTAGVTLQADGGGTSRGVPGPLEHVQKIADVRRTL